MAGYSGTPLTKKVGVKSGDRVFFANEPAHFRELLGELPTDVHVVSKASGELDVVVLFTTSSGELREQVSGAAKRLAQTGMLWVAWPKRTSGVATDLNENMVREIGLAEGLVDTKVCVIDETWSGLRFVIRLKDRKQ